MPRWFRSFGFRQRKAGSLEYRVQTMESRVAGVLDSDNGKLDCWSNRFRQQKARITRKGGEDAFKTITQPRGKYSYLSINCNFDENSCEPQFSSKWGQTVDA